MHDTLTMEAARMTLGGERVEGVLGFLASRSKDSARALPVSVAEVFHGMYAEVRGIISTALNAKTGAEFTTTFNETFPKYVGLMLAMAHFANAVIPLDVRDRLNRESICELEADFRDNAVNAFGSQVRDQAIFTVWTLRKINDLVNQIVASKIEASKRKEEQSYCEQFNIHMLGAQFGLDCLSMALDGNVRIYPEVLDVLIDRMRSMVDAYAWARRGLDVRAPQSDVIVTSVAFDDEDEEWMNAASEAMGSLLEDENSSNGPN